MKKAILGLVVLSLLISFPAFAEETKKEEMPMGMGMGRGMGGMGMGMGMGKMCPPMMETAQMVATDEGGVIVLAGNKLMKYDADLNLVKEVELKMSKGPKEGKICPITGKMIGQDASAGTEESAGKTA